MENLADTIDQISVEENPLEESMDDAARVCRRSNSEM